jgi:hypothetical protein
MPSGAEKAKCLTLAGQELLPLVDCVLATKGKENDNV